MAFVVAYVLLFSVGFFSDFSSQQGFVVPEASVELLFPVGFSVSIPDTEGIRLFAFHGKLNEEFDTQQEGGYYSADITRAKNDRWTYTDRRTRFKVGDVIHYWLFVDYYNGRNQLGYTSEFRKFSVTECPRRVMDEKGVCNAPHSPRFEAPDSSQFEVPNATVEILQPKGFKVSIPDQEGISLFAFHGKINQPLEDREAGDFSRDITKAKNGRWTFTEKNTLLKPGDILYYWLYADYTDKPGNRRGYLKEHQEFVVPGLSRRPCEKSLTKWNDAETCAGQLLLNEDFDLLNRSNWTKDIVFADEPDYEFVIYDNFDENLNIKDGKLHIRPTLSTDKYGEDFIYRRNGYDLGSSCTAEIEYDCKRVPAGGYGLPPVFSARITSNNFFKYGRVDIRARLPKGDWIYPQLVLTPRQYEYGKRNYDSGEIRIAFAAGNKDINGELQGKILLGTSSKARNYGITRTSSGSGEGWSDNYHVFSVVWTPNSLTFSVDNKEYGKIIPPEGSFSRIFEEEKEETAASWKLGGSIAPFDQEVCFKNVAYVARTIDRRKLSNSTNIPRKKLYWTVLRFTRACECPFAFAFAMRIKIGVGVGGHSFPDTIPHKPYTNIEGKPHLKFYREKERWNPTWNEGSELIVDYVKVYAL